ncbi:MAG: hypothetical protein ACNI25_03890 [Halarcobacter sp.]
MITITFIPHFLVPKLQLGNVYINNNKKIKVTGTFLKIAVRDAWNFQLRNTNTNNQLLVDAIESYPLGIPSSSQTGYFVGGEGMAEIIYQKVKNYFYPKPSGYDPNDKSVPK